MTGNHRGHGHPIGKAAALGPLMAEPVGRADGLCGGKGGAMHLANIPVGPLGESGIAGSSIPIATGAALSAKVPGEARVSPAFFGDGAANRGCLYEAISLASVWKLPMILLCENNRYARSTPAHTVIAGRIADRAAGFGMPGVRVEDGQDVLAVDEAVSAAAERARGGGGPSLAEVMTYRFREPSEGLRIGVEYRDAEEKAAWLARDPIRLFAGWLAANGVLDEAGQAALEAEVEAAAEFAGESDRPAREAAFADLFTEPEGAAR